MKPQNNSPIKKAYYKFSFFLFLTVFLTAISFWGFLKTSSNEILKIQQQVYLYDEIYTQTIDLVTNIDSTSNYLKLLNRNHYDNARLTHLIGLRKLDVQKTLNEMDQKDCAVHKKINDNLAYILNLKDSIRLFTQRENMARTELVRCLNERKQVAAKVKR